MILFVNENKEKKIHRNVQVESIGLNVMLVCIICYPSMYVYLVILLIKFCPRKLVGLSEDDFQWAFSIFALVACYLETLVLMNSGML